MSDPNKHAFPITGDTFKNSGLSKLEFFAAMALQSAITLPWAQGNPNQAAITAVHLADCLIRALATLTPSGERKL